MASYYSDREHGERPRTVEEVGEEAWRGLQALIEAKITGGWFGLDYPDQCPDGQVTCGTDRRGFVAALRAEVPGVELTDPRGPVPAGPAVLDAVEFCYRTIALPTQFAYHDYHRHHHLRFDREAGRVAFREEINRILARQGLTYELREDGQVVRLGPEPAHALVSGLLFATGDATLNGMLEDARSKYLSPDKNVRKEALEKLWDAFERLKTIEPGKDKKTSAGALLARASDQPEFRDELAKEGMALTEIGNAYQIRHFETGKIPVDDGDQIDYLVHRMFAFIWLCLKKTGRVR